MSLSSCFQNALGGAQRRPTATCASWQTRSRSARAATPQRKYRRSRRSSFQPPALTRFDFTSLLKGFGASEALQRGFTLVEVLVVVALMAILSSAIIFGTGMLSSSRLRGATSLIASAVRLGIARANTTGHAGRLVLDLDNDRVLLEEATGSVMLREKKAPAGGAQAATEAEQKAKQESDRILDGPHAPRANFHPVPSFADSPQGRELGKGVDLSQVQTEHDEQPVITGRAYVYFWPGGLTERAYIQLKRAGTVEGLTVVVSPLTGRSKIEKGLIDMPEPRTDKEEDQGDREAL